MSRPARPYAADPLHPDVVDPCCDGLAPVPRWTFYAGQIILAQTLRGGYHGSPAQLEADARAACIAAYENPDRPWCRRCATALEDFRDEVSEGVIVVLEMVATIASFFPGVGTVIADVAGTMAALAAGESLSDALVSGALSAIPGGPVWAGAATACADLLKGVRVDRALLDGSRAAVVYEGGPLAAAAFDAVIAIAQGKAIQDAGFAALKALASGNTLAERAANFAESVTLAAEQGRSVVAVLQDELMADLVRVAGGEAQALVGPLVDRIVADPSLLAWGSQELADAWGVAEPLARAAQAIMRTGEPDPALVAAIHASYLASLSVAKTAPAAGAANVLRTVYAISTPAQRAAASAAEARKVLLASPAHAVPALLAAAKARVGSALATAPAPASVAVPVKALAPVRASAPVASAPASASSAALVGGAVGAAGLLVAWLVWRR